jgi:hypothetical protein
VGRGAHHLDHGPTFEEVRCAQAHCGLDEGFRHEEAPDVKQSRRVEAGSRVVGSDATTWVDVRLVLDAGALIALERNERAMWRRLNMAIGRGQRAVTHAGVLGQVWRDGSRQALLVRALRDVEVRPVDDALARSIGELLRLTRTSDVVDAGLVLLAEDGDLIMTSDGRDLGPLRDTLGRSVGLMAV